MAKQTFTTGSVLTATQMNNLQANDYNWTVSQKSASYVLTAADAGTRVEMNSASNTTVTVNTGLFAAGDTLFIQNIGSGNCVITAGTATVNKATNASLALAQYQGGTLYFISASSAIFFPFDVGSPAASGGMTLLSTTSLSSTTTTISITATGYNYLYIYLGEYYNAGDTLKIRFNSDTGNNYSSSYMAYEGSGSATGSTAPAYSFGRGQSSYQTYVNASSPYTMNAVFLLHDPTSTENDKLVQYWAGGTQTATPYLGWNWGQGFYQGSGAITSITLFNTNTHSGTVKIYGVK